jgi:asparagine synthetase B (glutamine-hydrolysing)
VLPFGMAARRMGATGAIGARTRQKMVDFTEAMRSGSLYQQQMCLTSLFDSRDKSQLALGALAQVSGTFADQTRKNPGWPSLLSSLVRTQTDHFLPDGVLTPYNKLMMSSGIAPRLPFADHKMAEFMFGVPDHLRRTRSRRKTLLRNYIDRKLPALGALPPQLPRSPADKSLLDLCLNTNPLKEMVETCLSETSVKRRELFDWPAVRRILAGSKAGEVIYMRQVFSLLVLELWFRIFVDHEKGWISK